MDKPRSSRSPSTGSTGKVKSPARVSQGSSNGSRRSSLSPKPPSSGSTKARSPSPAALATNKLKASGSKTSSTSGNNNSIISTTTTKAKTAKTNNNGSLKKRRSRSQLPSANINSSKHSIGSSSSGKSATPRDSLQLYEKNSSRLTSNVNNLPVKNGSPAKILQILQNQINSNANHTGTGTTSSGRGRSDSVPAAITESRQNQNQTQRKLSLAVTPSTETKQPSFQLPLSRSPRSSSRHKTNLSQASIQFRQHVMQAVADRKIFSTQSQFTSHVRNSLRARGWIEKVHQGPLNVKTVIGAHLSRDVDFRGQDDERDEVWCARVLEKYPSDFIWVIRRDNVEWKAMLKEQMINRFPRANFTTKVGITSCLQAMHWFTEPGLADTFFPRCYRLSIEEEKLGFIDDYRLTACIGLLKWLTATYEQNGEMAVSDKISTITPLCIDFAVRQINNYVRTRRHEDLDWLVQPSFSGTHWDTFLTQFYRIVHKKEKLGPCDPSEPNGIWGKYDMAKKSLSKLKFYWPQYETDGMLDIWICKPGARSRGRGIIVLNEMDKVLELVNNGNQREANWVAQKYIERPLLIYKTKFDIRQWFAVTDWSPITIWFYKESYVRFCTKQFTLESFHESVHLCNNAVQALYKNEATRDDKLPDENMWDSYQFQAYLKTIGKLDAWSKVIYPGMKESIVGVMLASQDQVEQRKNCFELYGADFMLSEDLKPWLIEINSSPCMSSTTSVTARMCPQCLDDLMKVVVDRRDNKNCDTGFFELIYRQNPANLNVQQFGSVDLYVQGKKLPKDVDWPGIMTKYNSKRTVPAPAQTLAPKVPTPLGTGLTFMDLVQKLRLKGEGSDSTTTTSQPQEIKPLNEKSGTNTKSNKTAGPTGPLISVKDFPFPTAGLTDHDNSGTNPFFAQIQNRAKFVNGPSNPAIKAMMNTGVIMGLPWALPYAKAAQYPTGSARSKGQYADMSLLIRNPNSPATMEDLLRLAKPNNTDVIKSTGNSKASNSGANDSSTNRSNPKPKPLVKGKGQKQNSTAKSIEPTAAQPSTAVEILNNGPDQLKAAINAIRQNSKNQSAKDPADTDNPGL